MSSTVTADWQQGCCAMSTSNLLACRGLPNEVLSSFYLHASVRHPLSLSPICISTPLLPQCCTSSYCLLPFMCSVAHSALSALAPGCFAFPSLKPVAFLLPLCTIPFAAGQAPFIFPAHPVSRSVSELLSVHWVHMSGQAVQAQCYTGLPGQPMVPSPIASLT